MSEKITEVTKDILPNEKIDCVVYGCTSGTIAAGYQSIEKKIKKAKTPGDFKSLFDSFLADFVSNLSPDADIHWEVCSFIPICLEYRETNKKELAVKIRNIIKRGWPGKTDNVLDRQTDLFILSFFGFIDHVVHKPVEERQKILKDFRNMLNLHLQDRLFF